MYAVEDILNMALRRIGNEIPIGYIYEGSRASRAGLEIYGQTRDALLRSFTWGFARRDAALMLLKTAPVGGYGATPWTSASPPPPWIFEYAYPTDCLVIRSVRESPLFIPSFDPKPNLFNVANDDSIQPAVKVILTNVENALVVYTGQVTDMTTWEPLFVESLVDALGRRFAQALSTDPNLLKIDAAEERTSVEIAASVRG
jgi:hypothetical protein